MTNEIAFWALWALLIIFAFATHDERRRRNQPLRFPRGWAKLYRDNLELAMEKIPKTEPPPLDTNHTAKYIPVWGPHRTYARILSYEVIAARTTRRPRYYRKHFGFFFMGSRA